nr:MAG: hypothetical protein EDM05_35525 [Leptolyngbya sp. IPPAS B-1204]RNJ64661.1 MAG: hypothetical protein EDM05_35320 [Leptolyngbya sp. IPPAS B-1204]
MTIIFECSTVSSILSQRGKQTCHSLKGKQDPGAKCIKQSDLDTLKLAEQQGHIVLKYLDESGFCLWNPVSYSYS